MVASEVSSQPGVTNISNVRTVQTGTLTDNPALGRSNKKHTAPAEGCFNSSISVTCVTPSFM